MGERALWVCQQGDPVPCGGEFSLALAKAGSCWEDGTLQPPGRSPEPLLSWTWRCRPISREPQRQILRLRCHTYQGRVWAGRPRRGHQLALFSRVFGAPQRSPRLDLLLDLGALSSPSPGSCLSLGLVLSQDSPTSSCSFGPGVGLDPASSPYCGCPSLM